MFSSKSFIVSGLTFWTFLIAKLVKNLPAWVRFQGWEDPLEKEMAIHASILAWKVPWAEEPGRLQSMESQDLDTVLHLDINPF